MSERHVRLLRALGVATLIMSLSAGAHVAAGGMLPQAGVLTALGLLILIPTILATGRALSFRTVVGLIGLGQLVLHHAFAALSVPGHCLPSAQVGHLHHDLVSCTVAAAPAATTVSALPMLGMHIVAVLVTSVALARADAALTTVRCWMTPLLGLVGLAPLPVPALRLSPWSPLLIGRLSREITHHGVRGPPQLLPGTFAA